MTKGIKWLGNFAILLFILSIISGCAQNNPVGLGYPAPGKAPEARPGAASICVVMFEDARSTIDIGQRSDGSAYVAKNSVPEWGSKALADELANKGYVVTWAPTLAMAKSSGVGYIVTGKIIDLWLSAPSMMNLRCVMQFNVKVESKSAVIYQESLSSTISRTAFPLTDPSESLLSSSLEEILKPLVDKISQKIQ